MLILLLHFKCQVRIVKDLHGVTKTCFGPRGMSTKCIIDHNINSEVVFSTLILKVGDHYGIESS